MLVMIWNVLLLSAAVFAVAKILPGMKIKNFGTAVWVAAVYSILNYLLSGILTFLALPFVLLTFGLFIFVINAFLLWVTDKLLDDFYLDGIGTTLLAALLITLFNMLLQWIF